MMTPIDFVIHLGRFCFSTAGNHLYAYIAVSGLDVGEAIRLMERYDGKYYPEPYADDVVRWKTTSVKSLGRVASDILEWAFENDNDLALKFGECLAIYASSKRGTRHDLSCKLMVMLNDDSSTITRIVGLDPGQEPRPFYAPDPLT